MVLNYFTNINKTIRISGVMVGVLVDRRSGKTKDYTVGICSLSANHTGVIAKTSWLGIRKICPSEATCLSADSCFNEIAL